MKGGSCLAGPWSPFRRLMRRIRRPREGGPGEHAEERGLSASWARWPGHEANFPAISRLLWEIGKSREKEEKEEKRSGNPNRGRRNR